MKGSPPVIVWFRRDLRLADNPALDAATAAASPVIPLYIHDEAGPPRARGGASKWWLDKSLRALAADLRARGAALVLRRGEAGAVLDEIVAASGARSIVWNRLYDAASVARDTALKARLEAAGLSCRSFNAGLLNEPWTVKTGAGGPFRVFTPYWRAARAAVDGALPSAGPGAIRPARPAPATDRLERWGLHPTRPDWSEGFADWRPGEAGARGRLDGFLEGAASAYATGRNLMGREGTSRLSPHLHFGEIGPRQVWAALDQAVEAGRLSRTQADAFQRELGWRDFDHALLFANPSLPTSSLYPRFDRFDWRDDPDGLAAWTRGRTGYPIVDAAMRQLWTSGWMHNRARMIAASFLIKDLLIDWRRGEAWFWDTLVDADLANNTANWQWVAGSGADAAPFFRVFNPVLQGAKFDPDGAYVRRWVPELAHLPDRLIHQPWAADAATLRAAGVALGADYPRPIVEHAAARDRALAAYGRLP